MTQKGHANNKDKVKRYLSKCTLIVVRRTMNNSKPCNHCLQMIKESGIKRVYYSYDKGLKMEKVNQMETSHLSARYRNKGY